MESFSIELIEVIIRKFSKRNVFAKYCKYLKYNLKYNYTKIQLQIIGCTLANMSAYMSDPKTKYESYVRKLHFSSRTLFVFVLHFHITFVFFWDKVRSKKI